MVQWEYDLKDVVYDNFLSLIKWMNMMGSDGWEAVEVIGGIKNPIDRSGDKKTVIIKILWKRKNE